MSIKNVTDSEKLFITRRRTGENMNAAAKKIGLPLITYRKLERGEVAVKQIENSSIKSKVKSRLVVGRLSKPEELRLFRLRSGLTLTEISEHMKRSPWWIRLMELGEADSEELENFWKGFKFAAKG